MVSYRDIRQYVEPFDIFLFSGEGLVSRAIQAATFSPWSHVALSLRLPQYDMNLLYESTTLTDAPDLSTGTPTKGVQLVHLSERIAKYDGDVAWRQITGPKTENMVQAAAEFVREYQGRPYEKNQLALVASAIDAVDWFKHADTSSVFCSELAAEMLRRVGIMTALGEPSEEFTPADFADMNSEWLNSDWGFGPLVPLK